MAYVFFGLGRCIRTLFEGMLAEQRCRADGHGKGGLHFVVDYCCFFFVALQEAHQFLRSFSPPD